MTITERIIEADESLYLTVGDESRYHYFITTDYPGREGTEYGVGVHAEEGEFLYSLIRLIRPKLVLETGTNVGISGRYIALALADNGGGRFDTIEHDGAIAKQARLKIKAPGITVNVLNMSTSEFVPTELYDMMFFDSDPKDRFADMDRMFDHLNPGGIVGVHDQKNVENEGNIMGGIPASIKQRIHSGELRGMVFMTDHGLCVFQKPFEQDWIKEAIK